MPGNHAKLSPSSAERWLTCPGSVRLIASLPPTERDAESVYATEGTHAHRVAELIVLRDLGQWDGSTTSWQAQLDKVERAVADPDAWHEMFKCGLDYSAWVKTNVLDELGWPSKLVSVSTEQRVQTGIPGCWGTADCVVSAPGYLHVIDYKYGRGVAVSPDSNPQGMLYAVGALDRFDLVEQITQVCITIYQPRIAGAQTWCLDADELRRWRDDDVAPTAQLALSGEGYFQPSETACRWCPAAGECRARAQYVTQLDFGEPLTLTNVELGQLLARLPDIEAWCRAVREIALRKAYREGEVIPGWKVVRASGKRTIRDAAAAIETLVNAGYDPVEVAKPSLRTLAELERLTGGKDQLQAVLGDLLHKPEGKESLVPDTDERLAITNLSDAQSEVFGRLNLVV